MRREVAVAAIALFVTYGVFASPVRPATNQELSALKSAMEESLKDADSAKFKDVEIGDEGVTCGKVNAKNSYGAYAGFTPFMAMKLASGKFFVLDVSETSAAVCAGKGFKS